MRIRRRTFLFSAGEILFCLLFACKSAQLTKEDLTRCLDQTATGTDQNYRADIVWLIEYDTKVKETKCCAIEPRPSLLQKRDNLTGLKLEVLSRIDDLERGSDSEGRARLRKSNACYAALMDLYHDVVFAARARRDADYCGR